MTTSILGGLTVDLLNMTEHEVREELTKKKFTEWYADSSVIRALVQLIPPLGTVVDALLAWPGVKSKEKRVLAVILALHRSVSVINQRGDVQTIVESEEFKDCLDVAIDSSIATRSRQKILMNAMIIANLINVRNTGNYRPEEYLRAIYDLSPMEVAVLNILSERNYSGLAQKVSKELGLDVEDLKFLLRRLERTGFVDTGKIPSVELTLAGMNYTASPALVQFTEYLRLHPFAEWIGDKNFHKDLGLNGVFK